MTAKDKSNQTWEERVKLYGLENGAEVELTKIFEECRDIAIYEEQKNLTNQYNHMRNKLEKEREETKKLNFDINDKLIQERVKHLRLIDKLEKEQKELQDILQTIYPMYSNEDCPICKQENEILFYEQGVEVCCYNCLKNKLIKKD